MADFDAEAFKIEMKTSTNSELYDLLKQLGRNGETTTSKAREIIVEAELASRKLAGTKQSGSS